MNRYVKIFIVLLAIVPVGVGVFIWQQKDANEANQTTASEHDETNSDGHHDNDSEESGDVLDLTAETEVFMDIKDYAYTKPNITIKKGTKVTWTNQDVVQHNVMAEHEGASQAHDPPIADQIDPDEFAGPLLERGESYSFTFNEASSNPYHCSPHPYMTGSVTVVE